MSCHASNDEAHWETTLPDGDHSISTYRHHCLSRHDVVHSARAYALLLAEFDQFQQLYAPFKLMTQTCGSSELFTPYSISHKVYTRYQFSFTRATGDIGFDFSVYLSVRPSHFR